MSDLTIISEVRRHLHERDWHDAFDTLAHEGLKRSVEVALGSAASSAFGRDMLTRLSGSDWSDPLLQTQLAGRPLDGPTGIAAGWDKTGNSILAWQAMGANHITVGGVPLHPQTGNPMPRLFTFDEYLGDHGKGISLNRYGFYSPGADQVVKNVWWQRDTADVMIPVGVQVTVNKELYDPARQHEIPARLADTIKKVLPVADFISLGLSSPNTIGMRDAQSQLDFIRSCFVAARDAAQTPNRYVEVYAKTDGDGGLDRVDDICELVVEADLDGVELINTTTDPDIKGKYGAQSEAGGLAGADSDFQALAVASVKRAYENIGDSKRIHGMGGINGIDQNAALLAAGASVTSFNTYVRSGGIRSVTDVEKGLVKLIRNIELGSLAQLIGIASDRGALEPVVHDH